MYGDAHQSNILSEDYVKQSHVKKKSEWPNGCLLLQRSGSGPDQASLFSRGSPLTSLFPDP